MRSSGAVLCVERWLTRVWVWPETACPEPRCCASPAAPPGCFVEDQTLLSRTWASHGASGGRHFLLALPARDTGRDEEPESRASFVRWMEKSRWNRVGCCCWINHNTHCVSVAPGDWQQLELAPLQHTDSWLVEAGRGGRHLGNVVSSHGNWFVVLKGQCVRLRRKGSMQ